MSLRRFSSVALVLFAVAKTAPAQQTAPTIGQLDGAPFASALVAAPAGGTVAWVLNARGLRNVWAADAAGGQARVVTAFTADDGQDITDLTFSRDGRTLYFVRGGGPNRAGEVPNPTSDAGGAEQAVWRVGLDGSAVGRVAEGSQPAPSRTGLAFVRRGQVFWLADSATTREAVPMFRSRGTQGSLRWSPDESRLAFASNRGTHAFVGVYEPTARRITWLGPSTDTDGQAAWSPDGNRVAFIRIPYERRRMLFTPERDGEPWSILVGDARTGKASTVWTAAKGVGSVFREIVSDNQLQWGVGDRIVFPWERDGWTHLYSVSAAGRAATLLTPGDGEVEYVMPTPDGRRILYNTNQGDIDRRHVRMVAVDGSAAPIAVTNGDGIEWNPVMTAGGTVIVTRSSARDPAQVARVSGERMVALAPSTIPADFPSAQLVVPRAVTIRAADGIVTHGQLFLPPDYTAGERRPAVIFLHGGSRRQMLLGWNYSSYYHHAYAMNQALALRGAVVLQLNYRSGIGYGMAFREAIGYGATGGTEYRDLAAAGRWLAARADVDPKRIALWGGSYGGYLTAMGLTRDPQLFSAGVDIHGVHDWNVGIATFLPDYNPLEDPVATALAFSSSPLSTVKAWKAPVLVIHGDDDRNVRFIETQTLVAALRKQGVHVEQLVFPDEIHSFLRHASWQGAYTAALDFLARTIGTRP